ncbi:Serine 3-dehydrogenase/3-hydroxy acid dehydrogenase / malonic semialdehyde reductase [Sphingomonas antarctica]|uniref:SDR family oxidoreductase n=1 Tax=Sphingomonas antarctica TaxID=2040274 RepID=UPI0039E8C4F7
MIVFVTGATAGFGAAIARKFLQEGHQIVGAGRRSERLSAFADEFGRDWFHPVPLDVTRNEDVSAAVHNLPETFRAIDLLVNNAGLARGLEPAHKSQIADWDAMIDTNVRGLTYVTHAVLPGMVERNRGHIMNMGSIASTYPYPGGNVYGATKAYVRQFSLNLRADLAATLVRVTDVESGLVGGSEFSVVRFKGDAERAASLYEGANPLTPEDIADTVHWIATRPPHVNINTIVLMPVSQTFGPLPIARADQRKSDSL